MIYDNCVDILKPIITSDDRKITKSRDMQITLELPQGHTWKVPYTTPDACQRDAKQTNIIGPTLPPSDFPFDSLGPVSRTQGKQILQPANNVPSKRKIKNRSLQA